MRRCATRQPDRACDSTVEQLIELVTQNENYNAKFVITILFAIVPALDVFLDPLPLALWGRMRLDGCLVDACQHISNMRHVVCSDDHLGRIAHKAHRPLRNLGWAAEQHTLCSCSLDVRRTKVRSRLDAVV